MKSAGDELRYQCSYNGPGIPEPLVIELRLEMMRPRTGADRAADNARTGGPYPDLLKGGGRVPRDMHASDAGGRSSGGTVAAGRVPPELRIRRVILKAFGDTYIGTSHFKCSMCRWKGKLCPVSVGSCPGSCCTYCERHPVALRQGLISVSESIQRCAAITAQLKVRKPSNAPDLPALKTR